MVELVHHLPLYSVSILELAKAKRIQVHPRPVIYLELALLIYVLSYSLHPLPPALSTTLPIIVRTHLHSFLLVAMPAW